MSHNLCDLLEAGKIDIYQFNRMLRYSKGPCPIDCPDRKVGCKNVKTCPVWAEHVALTKRIYALRKKYQEIAAGDRRNYQMIQNRIQARKGNR